MSSMGIRGALYVSLLALAAPLSAYAPEAKVGQGSELPASARSAAATVDAFHAALRRGDTNSAAKLLAHEALIYESGGVERSKAEYASHHLAADAEFTQAVPSTMSRRAGNSNGAIAWIASEGRTTGMFRGRPVDQVTTETMVLRRVGPSWRIVHIHWSSAAKK